MNPLIFPKVPQSSQTESLGFPHTPPPPSTSPQPSFRGFYAPQREKNAPETDPKVHKVLLTADGKQIKNLKDLRKSTNIYIYNQT